MTAISSRSRLPNRLEHVVGALLLRRRLADADAHAQERVVVQVLLDRAQPVVPGEAAADLDPQHRGARSSSSCTITSCSGSTPKRRTSGATACPESFMYVVGTASARRFPPTRTSSTSARSLLLRSRRAVPAREQLDDLGTRRCASCPRTPRRDCRARPRAGRRACRCARMNAVRAAARASAYSEAAASSAAPRAPASSPSAPSTASTATSPSPSASPRGTEIMATRSSASLVTMTPAGTWRSPTSELVAELERGHVVLDLGRELAGHALDRERVHELLEHAALRHAFGLAEQVEAHLGLDRLVGAHPHEVDVDDVPFTGSRCTWRASASSSLPSSWSVISVLAPVRDERMWPSWCALTVTDTLSAPRP